MIRFGVIGYGRRIRSVLATLNRFNADTRVVALVDPRASALRDEFAEALNEATVYDDVDRMLDAKGVDGVLIGTRCTLHATFAIKVLDRNLPLFLEKPVATSWEQVADLRRALATTSSPVVVSFPLRVSTMCETVREIVDSGAIGTIEHVQAVNNVPYYASGYYQGWMRDEEQTGGLWLQKATHDFDYINSLVRQRPVRISAMESKTVFRGEMPAGLKCVDCASQGECFESPYNLFYRRDITPQVEPGERQCAFAVDTGNHDSASALIQYETGMHVVYSQNFYTRRGAAARGATLIGYRGTIKFDWYQDEIVVHHHHSDRVERHRFETTGDGHHGGDKELAHDFLGCITSGARTRTPLEAGLLSVQLCLLARESCRLNAVREVVTLVLS